MNILGSKGSLVVKGRLCKLVKGRWCKLVKGRWCKLVNLVASSGSEQWQLRMCSV